MAKIVIPPGVPTVISAGTANDILIANDGSGQVALNTTDSSPGADGGVINLAPNDTVAMSAGGSWAASQWVAYSNTGSVVVVTEP